MFEWQIRRIILFIIIICDFLTEFIHFHEFFLIYFQDMKLTNQLLNKHGDNLEDKSLTICSGTDYININYQHVVCPNAETAKVSIQS